MPYGPDIDIDAVHGEVDVDIYEDTESVTVHFDNGAEIEINVQGQEQLVRHHIHLSLKEAVGSNGLFNLEVTSDGESVEISGMTVTLPYNIHKGEPKAYEYPNPHDLDNKNEIKADIDESGKTISFTAFHSGLYGIEYSETPGPVPPGPEPTGSDTNYIPLVIGIIALLAIIGFAIWFYSKH